MDDPDLQPNSLFSLWCHLAERGDPDPGGGTEYSLDTACNSCGTGARQTSPLRLKRGDAKPDRPMAQTLCGWLLLNDSVVKPLKREFDIAGDLTKVEDVKSGERLPFWQLRPKFVMPRTAPETEGMITNKQCPKCRRDGYFHTVERDLTLAYKLDASTSASLPLLAQTWECFGNSIREDRKEVVDGVTLSYVAGFAVPQVLARGDVCAALRRLIGPSVLSFHPVVLLKGKQRK